MSEYTRPLSRLIEFLVRENRNSDLDPDRRAEILQSKRFGRILRILYPFGFAGGLFFAAGSVIRPPAFTMFRGLVMEDHASKVVRNSLDRTLGIKSEMELKKIKPPRFAVLSAFFRNLGAMKRAYKVAEIRDYTEYARVFSVFFFYTAWKAFFYRMKPEAALLARTNDPKRLALGAAAEESSVPVVVFTVDRVAVRTPAPFVVHAALCWTKRQKIAAEKVGIPVARMPVPAARAMKLPVPGPERGIYGLLLNAKCDPEKVAAWIRDYSSRVLVCQLKVRPHPGFDATRLVDLPRSIVCDWREPLGEYLDGLDMVFALNTNAVIDALLHGVPVVYLGGLDPYKYDVHRYVVDGIAYPYSSEDDFPVSISLFYSSNAFRERWNSDEFVLSSSEESSVLSKFIGLVNDRR